MAFRYSDYRNQLIHAGFVVEDGFMYFTFYQSINPVAIKFSLTEIYHLLDFSNPLGY